MVVVVNLKKNIIAVAVVLNCYHVAVNQKKNISTVVVGKINNVLYNMRQCGKLSHLFKWENNLQELFYLFSNDREQNNGETRLMTRIVFKNMNTNIYGDWVVDSGCTFFTREDLSRAVITQRSDVTSVTIDGQKHFIQFNEKLEEFLK